MVSSAGEPDQDFSTTFARGLSVIRCFSHDTPELSVSEAAELVGMSRTAARRFLLTLAALGYATFDDRRFRLTAKVLDLGYAYLSSMDIWGIAQPFLEQLSSEVQESCGASVLEGTEVVHVIHAAPRRILSALVSAGTRQPAHATALGRVHLAALAPDALDRYFLKAQLTRFTARTLTTERELRKAIDETERLGYALVDQELEEGLRAIAVPLYDHKEAVVGAVVVSCHAGRVDLSNMIKRILPRLQATVRAIHDALPNHASANFKSPTADPHTLSVRKE